jgi:hypothetical protein
MNRDQVPYGWVGLPVELWTLTSAPNVATDTGELIDVSELGIVFRDHSRGADSRADAFYPWGVVYRIARVLE